jgi:hypothetical protein
MGLVEGKYHGRVPASTRWEVPAQQEGAEDGDAGGAYNAAESVFESKDHLLHGMLHLNGYGHLLRMNGSQGGSRKLIGEQGQLYQKMWVLQPAPLDCAHTLKRESVIG